MPYRRVKRREVEQVFGNSLPEDIPLNQVVAEVRQRWELFYILPNLTSYYNDPQILSCWRELLGQNVLLLYDPSGISELIAATIGLAEEAISLDDLPAELAEAGTKKTVAK